MKKLIWILGCVLLLLLLPSTALAGTYDRDNDGYHDGDVAVVNNIIDNNGLQATKDAPESWDFAVWDENEPKRVVVLDLNNKNLSGTIDLWNLKSLVQFNCDNNHLTEINIAELENLKYLYCSNNNLKKLNDIPSQLKVICFTDNFETIIEYSFVAAPIMECGLVDDAAWLALACDDNGVLQVKEYDLESKVVTLTATPKEGYALYSWGDFPLDADATYDKASFTLDENVIVGANFEKTEEIEAQEFAEDGVVMMLGEKKLRKGRVVYTTDAAPIMVDNRVMVPIRTVTEAFNGKAEWNETAQRVTLCFDDREISMTIGSTQACVETTMEKDVELDVAPLICDDRTYVPIRFVAEALDAQVQWNGEDKTILITK